MNTVTPLLQQPGLEFAFRMLLQFGEGPRIRFTPAFKQFTRGYVSVLGGTVEGPMLNGKVLAQSGGDWPHIWQSGLIEFEAHYMLEAEDGAPIYINNRGLAYASADTMAAIERNEQPAVAPYCRISPRFEAEAGPHEWLNRSLIIGTGERRGNQSIFEYYRVS